MTKYDLEKTIENNLFKLFAKDFKHARDAEFFIALANSLRQIIGEKWFHSLYDNISSKRIYVLSFEYSFGENLYKNLIKLDLLDDVKEILKKHEIKFENIEQQDLEFALGFGDLGEISSYLLSALTNHHNNVYAYGLRYRKGMLKQEIIDGKQIEKPDDWKVNKNPWEHEKGFSHNIIFSDYEVEAIPYDIPIVSNDSNRVNTLRLWKSYSKTDINFDEFSKGEINNAYNDIIRANSIVEFLYPSEGNLSGKKLRLTQEIFFASACIQDILKKYKKYMSDDIEKIHEYIKIQINDIHPAFAQIFYIYYLTNKYGIEFSKAVSIAKKTFVYMQLSILPESFETWDISLLSEVCPYLIDTIYKLDKYVKENLEEKKILNTKPLLIIHEGKVDMNNIIYFISKNIFTVVEDHIFLMQNNQLKELYFAYNSKIEFVQINYDSKQYLKESTQRESNPNFNHLDSSAKDFYNIKKENKIKLLDRLGIDKNLINVDSPFVMHMDIFHENKRQILSALGIALTYFRLKKNPNLDIPQRIYFFGGKSYPNYYIAKETISFINALSNLINNDLYIKDKMKIIFIKNYNMTEATYAIPACDINQKLELLNMNTSDITLYKSILSGANILESVSSFHNSDFYKFDISVYKFGETRDNIIFNNKYNMYEYLDNNPEIKEMFDFYRYQSKNDFPFDIDIIYNSIYYFNDSNFILKDLFEYVDELEKALNDYRNYEDWFSKIYDNKKKIINQNDKESIEEFVYKIGELDAED